MLQCPGLHISTWGASTATQFLPTYESHCLLTRRHREEKGVVVGGEGGGGGSRGALTAGVDQVLDNIQCWNTDFLLGCLQSSEKKAYNLLVVSLCYWQTSTA